MTTDKSQDPKTKTDSDDVPAIFATIHHKSEHRPDGYTEDEIVNMNRMANGKGKPTHKTTKPLLIASGMAIAALTVAGSVWALKTNAENKARAEREALALAIASPPPAAPEPQTNSLESMEAHFSPPVKTVRGFFIGQDREAARIAAQERGMIVWEASNGTRDSFYVNTDRCVEEIALARNENRFPYSACEDAGEALYENGNIKWFKLTPLAFGIEKVTLEEFAQIIVDNIPVSQLTPTTSRGLAIVGRQAGLQPCLEYVGELSPDTKLVVSGCNMSVSLRVEKSATADAQFD